MSTSRVFLQDNDPRISYSGGWSEVTSVSPGEHGETAHTTSQVGASATFRFRGSGITIFLSVTSPSTPSSAPQVDVTLTFDGQLFSFQHPGASVPVYGQRPFQIDGGLDPEVEHTLVITQHGGAGPLRLDSIEYTIGFEGNGQPYSPDGTLTPLSAAPNPPSPTSSRTTPPPNTPTPSPSSSPPQPVSSTRDDPSSQPRVDQTDSMRSSNPSPTSATSVALTSRAITTTDAQGVVITKILPPEHRIVTSTDSTGGLVLRTEPASSPQGAAALGTGSVIAVVLGVVVVLAIVGLGVMLLLRRGRRGRKRKDVEGSLNPFTEEDPPAYSSSLENVSTPALHTKSR